VREIGEKYNSFALSNEFEDINLGLREIREIADRIGNEELDKSIEFLEKIKI